MVIGSSASSCLAQPWGLALLLAALCSQLTLVWCQPTVNSTILSPFYEPHTWTVTSFTYHTHPYPCRQLNGPRVNMHSKMERWQTVVEDYNVFFLAENQIWFAQADATVCMLICTDKACCFFLYIYDQGYHVQLCCKLLYWHTCTCGSNQEYILKCSHVKHFNPLVRWPSFCFCFLLIAMQPRHHLPVRQKNSSHFLWRIKECMMEW